MGGLGFRAYRVVDMNCTKVLISGHPKQTHTGLLTIVLHSFEAHVLEVRCPSFIKDLGWRRLTWETKRQCVKNASPDLRVSVRDAAKEDVDR